MQTNAPSVQGRKGLFRGTTLIRRLGRRALSPSRAPSAPKGCRANGRTRKGLSGKPVQPFDSQATFGRWRCGGLAAGGPPLCPATGRFARALPTYSSCSSSLRGDRSRQVVGLIL